jgi:hypothetical protein
MVLGEEPRDRGRGPRRRRVLAVLESGAAGAAVIDFARELAEHEQVAITMVGVAPQVQAGPRCGCSPGDYNDAIRDAVALELVQALKRLGDVGDRVAVELLVEGRDPPLQECGATAGFDVVLLPARRRPFRIPSHPAATALRQTGAEVWFIDRRGRQLSSS